MQAFQYSPSGGRLMNYDYLSNEFILYANSGGTTLSEYREFASAVPTWTKSFVYLGDGLLSTITPNGAGGETTEFNHPDRLGTRTITNQATGGASEQTTLPFGTALNGESTVTNNKNRFTTYDRSARTGLDYAVNRNYDSKQGRFTTVDPIGMSASSLSSPQTLNLYSYCGNDPINHTDPDGLFFGKLFRWIGKVVNIVLRVVAAVVAVILVAAAIINVGNPMVSGAAIKGALFLAAGLLAYAFGSQKLQAIIGMVGAISTGRAGIIVNYSETNKVSLWQKVLGALSTVGAITNFFAKNTRSNEAKNQETDCGIFTSLLVSAIEYRRKLLGARARIGAYLVVMTQKYHSMEKGNVSGFLDELVGGGQKNDVYRHITGSSASVLLDGFGIVSVGDDIRQIGQFLANSRAEEALSSLAGNEAGRDVGHLMAARISGTLTASKLNEKIKKRLCK